MLPYGCSLHYLRLQARRKAEKAKKKAEASGGFGALMGIDDGDAEDILAKKRRKAEKKAAKKAAEEAEVTRDARPLATGP